MDGIAIVAMDGRFPGEARDPASLWQALDAGRDLVRRVPASRWRADRHHRSGPRRGLSHASDQGGFIEDIDLFDPVAFGLSPREAETLDPAQRLLLELSQRCWETAGLLPSAFAGRGVGVFVGGFTSDYLLLQLGDVDGAVAGLHTATGVMNTLLSNRLSHCWRLTGPSLTVDTACSSSLVALHLAARSVASGESELAFAGGVQLQLSPYHTAFETAGGFLSPDGRCRAFDHRADGYVRAEAAGLVILAPLARALDEGWPVLATLLGTATGHNGTAQGVSFPSAEAQAALLGACLKTSGVSPDEIGYVEAHGTGTRAGDRAELTALGTALGRQRRAGPLWVGSVKTNLGHSEAAAGVTGLIKTVLALGHRRIPPHLHWERCQDDLSLDELGLRLPLTPQAWPDAQPYAVVSAFGFGGANACAVVGPPPSRAPAAAAPSLGLGLPLVVRLSGPTPEHLPGQARALADRLADAGASAPAAAVCAAQIVRRERSRHAVALVADGPEAMVERLNDFARRPSSMEWVQGVERTDPARRGLAFLCCGMGPQWRDMGRELAAAFPPFAEQMKAWDESFAEVSGYSVLDALATRPADQTLLPAGLAQPLNVFVQASLARLLDTLGVRPDVVCGHSVGEIAAFHIAGALDMPTAAALVFHRSRLQGRLAGLGGMAAVRAGASVVAPLAATHGVCIAAVNSRASVTVSGPLLALGALLEDLAAHGIAARRLDVDVPYHSALMDPLQAEFRSAVAGLGFEAARVPLVSTVTGDGAADWCAVDFADYWWRNLREPVALAPALDRLEAAAPAAFLEIGAHPVLRTYIQAATAGTPPPTLAATLRRGTPDAVALAEGLARLDVDGVASPDWRAWLGDPAPPDDLPGQQWLKSRYWSESAEQAERRLAEPATAFLGYARHQTPYVWDVHLGELERFALSDHVVLGKPRLPMAAFLEMMHAAVRQAAPDVSVALGGIRLHRGVILGDAQRLTTRLDPATGMIRIEDGRGEALAEARAVSIRRRGDAPGSRAPDLSLPLARDDVYQAFRAMGFDYGPAFQRISVLRSTAVHAVAEIDGGPIPGVLTPPGVLDAALQTMLGLEHASAPGEMVERLPVAVEAAEFHAPLDGADFPLTAVARLRHRDLRRTVVDVDLLTQGGALAVSLHGITARSIVTPSALRGNRKPADLLLGLEWAALDERALPIGDNVARQWLIWRDDGEAARALADALAARGEPVAICSPDISLAAACARLPPMPPGCVLTSIDLSVLDWRSSTPEADAERLAGFVRRASEHEASAPGGAEFWVVTRDAQDERRPELIQAGLWGAARCLIDAESRGSWRGIVDLSGDMEVEDWHRLARLIVARPVPSQFRLRDRSWWTPRLTKAPGAAAGRPLWLRPDASYVVTGAFGAIGRLSAEHLAARGARHLVLLGQSDIPPREAWDAVTDPQLCEKLAWLRRLEAAGVRLLALGFDLADGQACRDALALARDRGFPEVRGLVHAAGRTADAPAATTTAQDFARVFGPKVAGLRRLLDSLGGSRLDFCLFHSSVSGLFPNFGQSAYAAANAYLDAMASALTDQGVGTLSIGWGPWTVGMAGDERLARLFDRQGLLPIAPDEASRLFDATFAHPDRHVLCVSIDWPVFSGAQRRRAWMFRAIAPAERTPAPAPAISPAALAALPPDARHAAALEDLARSGAAVSRLPVTAFGDDAVLTRMGFDSLMAVELQIMLEARWGRKLPVAELLGRSSIGVLARRLIAAAQDHRSDVGHGVVHPMGKLSPAASVSPADGDRKCPRT